MSVLERLLAAVTFGLVGGAVHASVDLLVHAEGLSPGDVLIAMSLNAVVAVPIVILLVLMLEVVVVCLPTRPNRQQWLGLLVGVIVIGLVAAGVLVTTKGYRDWRGLLGVLGSVPLALLAYGLVIRYSSLAHPFVGIVGAVCILQCVILAVCGIAVVSAWALHWTLSAVPLLVAGSVLTLGVVRIGRSPLRQGLLLLICLPATIGLFATVGQPSVVPQRLSQPRISGSKPNVVLIVLDTTRRDYVGCYGHSGNLTPVLDGLADEGVVYEQAISPAPWTVPAHASMFTGLFSKTHGCSYGHHLYLDEEFVTLAEMLRDDGYQTVALNSNYYVAQTELLQGFQSRVYLGGDYSYCATRSLSQAVGIPDRWADSGSGEACRELTRWLATEYDADQPFFLFINLWEPHSKYLPPLRERLDALPDDLNLIRATRLAQRFNQVAAHVDREDDPETLKTIRAMYAGEVRYQDRRLGDLIRLLRSHTDFENTLLVVTADHGENLGESGRWGHSFGISDVLIHVPLVIRYPSRFSPGTRMPGLCQTLDLVPTVFDVLKRDCPIPGLPGRSLVPEHFIARDHAMAEIWPAYPFLGLAGARLGLARGPAHLKVRLRALRTDTMKFVWSSDGRHRLYDIRNDPFESENLVSRMPDVAADLEHRLSELWTTQPGYVPKITEGMTADPLDEKTLERLRSLGYAGD